MSRHLPGRRTRGPVHASRRSPFPSRPAARLLAVALAGAALAACADERTPDPTEPAAARSAHSRAPIATSVPVVRIFFVNPTTGNDANDGATAKPFKTLTKALA